MASRMQSTALAVEGGVLAALSPQLGLQAETDATTFGSGSLMVELTMEV
jgi:hypothetical protein